LIVAELLPVALAQGTPPKPKASDYPVHARAGGFSIGAEFLYRTVPAAGGSVFVRDYLVVELALYGPERVRAAISTGQFSLRLNGGKRTLLAQPAEMVAFHQKWDPGRKQVILGAGNGRVVIGEPQIQPRFPGDPRVRRNPLPRVETEPTGQAPQAPAPEPAEVLKQAALPEGEQRLPVAGCLYFPYGKKTKSIRRLELLWQRPDSTVTLLLKPPAGR